MKYPPTLMYLKFRSNAPEHGNYFGIWIPLFIMAPIVLIFLLAAFLVVLPFLLLALLFTWNMWWWRWAWHAIGAIFGALHSLPGTEVQVEDRKQQIHIAIY
jgi:hypothetical protein